MERERFLNLHNGINIEVVGDIITKINNINADYHEKSSDKNFIPKPIILNINSFGGNVYDAIALYDIIRISKTPIYTFCSGYAMSSGLTIFLAGHKRFCTKNSTFMYHQLSAGGFDTLNSLKNNIEEYEHNQNTIEEIIIERTNITKQQLELTHKENKKWYIHSDEALKYGICDEIIDNTEVFY